MAQASDKAFEIEAFISHLTGKSRRVHVAANLCMQCDGPAVEFRDELSRREYTNGTGWCQKCQDAFFDVGEE